MFYKQAKSDVGLIIQERTGQLILSWECKNKPEEKSSLETHSTIAERDEGWVETIQMSRRSGCSVCWITVEKNGPKCFNNDEKAVKERKNVMFLYLYCLSNSSLIHATRSLCLFPLLFSDISLFLLTLPPFFCFSLWSLDLSNSSLIRTARRSLFSFVSK